MVSPCAAPQHCNGSFEVVRAAAQTEAVSCRIKEKSVRPSIHPSIHSEPYSGWLNQGEGMNRWMDKQMDGQTDVSTDFLCILQDITPAPPQPKNDIKYEEQKGNQDRKDEVEMRKKRTAMLIKM